MMMMINFMVKCLLLCFLLTFTLNQLTCSAAKVENNETCIMNSVCKNKYNGITRNSPCYQRHAPYENIADDDFYELLWNNCPHFFDDKGLCFAIICVEFNLLLNFIIL